MLTLLCKVKCIGLMKESWVGLPINELLDDLMEHATDFSCQGAKAAHAILLCKMERGSLT